ncbi:hypothetical protein WA158_006723 [Blastocystis sp. Blastoise]
MNCLVLALLFASVFALKPIDGFRPPSVPLIVMDPFISVWSHNDNLYDTWPRHWKGSCMSMSGMIRVDKKAYRWMGDTSDGIEPHVTQKSVVVYPTRTIYVFEQDGVELTVTFGAPDFVDKIEYLSLPFTYINYSVRSIDGKSHNVQVYFDNTAEMATDDGQHMVDWKYEDTPGYTTLSVGHTNAEVMNSIHDRITWGRWYISSPSSPFLTSATLLAKDSRLSFANNTAYPKNETEFRKVSDKWPVLTFTFDFGTINESPLEQYMVASYDVIYGMHYFGSNFIPYWKHLYNDMNTLLIKNAHLNKAENYKLMEQFDNDLMEKIYKKVPNDEYLTMTTLVYRQVTGGMEIVWNHIEEKSWIFMKEISSNGADGGDISTVDVIYPAVPLFLFLAPKTFKQILYPVLEYSNVETAKYGYSNPYDYEWAPHHIGSWPIANIKQEDQENMPVEETGNMLQLVLAIVQRTDNDLEWLKNYWPLLKKWADYLVKFLPDPGNQLCTDDFMGASPHNINLAIKGIVGLGAYAELMKVKGDKEQADLYNSLTESYYKWYKTMAYNNDHSKLQYDLPDSWSLKYNMVFQTVLNINIFSKEDMLLDATYYHDKQLNKCGVPLDSRATFTKADWLMWSACMGTEEQLYAIIHAMYTFANTSPSRVPFSDWYQTVDDCKVVAFRARTVIGGIYMPLLM